MFTPTRSLLLALVPASIVIVLDQITKAWALDALGRGPCGPDGDGCIDVFWTLRFNLVFNEGAAFSTGTSFGPVFALVAAIMSGVLLYMANQRTDRLSPLLLGTVVGGAIGNLIDRITRADDGIGSGAVIDFIDFQWWPVFNVADMAVVGGVIALIAHSMLDPTASGVASDPPADGGAGTADGIGAGPDDLSRADDHDAAADAARVPDDADAERVPGDSPAPDG
ncbi:MAG: signal peptidase II [Actinomycetota bacterium]